jgi:hypothetical protein
MNDTPKWLWPAALAAAIGVALWWLFQPDQAGRTGLGKLKNQIAPPPDPYAALGTAACLGGAMYYGGTTGGMAGAPLCTAVGAAVAPVLHAGANLAVDVIDGQGHLLRTGVNLATSAATDTYGAGKTVVSDVYSGGKTVAKDSYNFAKNTAGWVSGVTPAKKLLHVFGL